MTIKISQLANLTVTQANTIVPVVSNVTGTLTTVKGNVEQLQTYMLENAGNLIPRAGNIYSIGNSTTWWKDLWLSANTLYIGGVPMGISSGSLTFGGNVVGTSDLPTYTGPVSANAVSVGATTVFGNITTLPTMSIDGDTGNVTASDISTTGSLLTGGDITTTGDISTTGAVTTGDVSFALSPAGAVTVLGSGGFSGTLYTPGRIYETTTDGPGSGLRVLVTYVEYGPGSARSLPSPSGGTIKIIDGGSGYLDGDVVYITHFDDEVGGITATLLAQSVTGAPVTSGTITANTSVWSFDESGDTTVPGNISLPDNTAIYNVDASTAVFTSNVISDATSLYLTDTGNAIVYASDYIVLETNSDGNVASQWAFNQNGNIRFPDATTQSTAFSNTAPVITTLLSNSATQSDLIIGINANVAAANVGIIGYINLANTIQSAQVIGANLGMKGYVDSVASGSSYGNGNVASYLISTRVSVANIKLEPSGNITFADGTTQITAASGGGSNYGNANVTAYTVSMGFTNFSNVNVSALITTNGLTNFSNVNAKAYAETMGYQNFGNVNVAAYVTTANSAVIGYVDNAVSTANVGIISYIDRGNTIVTAGITTANLGMKGYVDSVASQSIYGNSNVKSYLTGGFDGNIIPSANAVYSLGSITNQWKELWVSNSTIYIGGVPISTDSQGNVNIDSITVPDLWAGNIYLGSTGYMSGLIFDNGTTVDGGTAQLGNIFVGSRDANLKLRSNVRIGTGTECWSVTTLVPGLSQDDHPSLIVLSNTKSISSTTGAVVISGGLGVAGNINIGGNLTVSNVYVPTASNSTGTTGQITWDGDYVYICIATDTWKRANISTW